VLAGILSALLAVTLLIAGFASARVGNDAKAHDPGPDSSMVARW
jgi:hypothetical protein